MPSQLEGIHRGRKLAAGLDTGHVHVRLWLPHPPRSHPRTGSGSQGSVSTEVLFSKTSKPASETRIHAAQGLYRSSSFPRRLVLGNSGWSIRLHSVWNPLPQTP